MLGNRAVFNDPTSKTWIICNQCLTFLILRINCLHVVTINLSWFPFTNSWTIPKSQKSKLPLTKNQATKIITLRTMGSHTGGDWRSKRPVILRAWNVNSTGPLMIVLTNKNRQKSSNPKKILIRNINQQKTPQDAVLPFQATQQERLQSLEKVPFCNVESQGVWEWVSKTPSLVGWKPRLDDLIPSCWHSSIIVLKLNSLPRTDH